MALSSMAGFCGCGRISVFAFEALSAAFAAGCAGSFFPQSIKAAATKPLPTIMRNDGQRCPPKSIIIRPPVCVLGRFKEPVEPESHHVTNVVNLTQQRSVACPHPHGFAAFCTDL